MKKITSFTQLQTGEGTRIAYTFSEISEDGEMASQNNKGNFIVLDPKLQKHIDAILEAINGRLGE